MGNRIKNTDYLVISARIKAMETKLLSRAKLEQILDAKTDEETLRILAESGYPAFDMHDPEKMDQALAKVRDDSFLDAASSAPDQRYPQVFKIKYDYHNLKAIIKADAVNAKADTMLVSLGRVGVTDLTDAYKAREQGNLPPLLAQAMFEAKEVLDTTKDPQVSDMLLDKYRFEDELKTAKQTGSAFLTGYVKMQIDAVNFKSLIRSLRMTFNSALLSMALIPGGNISEDQIIAISRSRGSGIDAVYEAGPFAAAAKEAQAAIAGGSLTLFEKLCDDAVTEYLSGALFVPFGEQPLVGYLAALENEYTNLRIVLMGKNAGLDPDVIRPRLRESYA